MRGSGILHGGYGDDRGRFDAAGHAKVLADGTGKTVPGGLSAAGTVIHAKIAGGQAPLTR